jgi:hypothetical protein
MFFTEPKHEWCYYFTKAELAQQTGDYQKILSLGREAASLGYKPTDQNEWIVFIKTNALTGDISTAKKISKSALEEDVRVRRGICSAWRWIKTQSSSAEQDKIQQVLSEFECNPR